MHNYVYFRYWNSALNKYFPDLDQTLSMNPRIVYFMNKEGFFKVFDSTVWIVDFLCPEAQLQEELLL